MLSVERDSRKSVVRFRQWYKPDEDTTINPVTSSLYNICIDHLLMLVVLYYRNIIGHATQKP